MNTTTREKGQMFLLAAIIIMTALIIIRGNVKLYGIVEQRKLLEARFESDIFNNIQNELTKALEFSTNEQENITTNVFDFANFTRDKMVEHSMDFKFLYVGCLANATSHNMNVSLINMMDEPINATLELDGDLKNKDNMVDGEKWDTIFTITPGTTYELIVSYNNTYNETVTIKTRNNNNVYVGYFDVYLETSDTIHRKNFQKSYKLKRR